MKTTPEMIARWTAQIANWRNAGPEYVIAVKPPDMLALLSDLAEMATENETLRAAQGREWVHAATATGDYRLIE